MQENSCFIEKIATLATKIYKNHDATARNIVQGELTATQTSFIIQVNDSASLWGGVIPGLA